MFQSFETLSTSTHSAERVKAVRAAMAQAKVDAFLVPRADEYQGEYVPPGAERLRWLTGFTGSAGLTAVLKKSAMLFTDGRYTVQAKAETDPAVVEISLLARPRLAEWLATVLSKGQTLGFDPRLHTASEIARLSAALTSKGVKLKPLSKNLIDIAWGKDRPKPPAGLAILQPLTLAGRSAAEKIADIQKRLKDDGQHAVILTLPDSICWLFNIRGSDIAHNPVVLAFAIVPASGKAELYVDLQKIDRQVKSHLSPIAKVSPQTELAARLKSLAAQGKRIRLDPETAAFWFEKILGSKAISRGADPCILPKAIKTPAEISGARVAQARDGGAMVRFLAWLESAAANGALDEIGAVKKLEYFRDATLHLREISFATISGSGPNGAIVHYRVNEATNRLLRAGELFLIDSGAQYQDGTTDVTRTVAIGEPSPDMRLHYTAVLKGHIAIATARFPKGTRGIDLDPFARRALWDIGADYDHGTGHGIGSYLSVHEGPQSISRAGMAVLQPGMLISNEPGYYKEGAYGIRLENIVLVTALEKISGGDREMMGFETLTLAPFDRRLIDRAMLTDAEISWLDRYHGRVFDELESPLDSATRSWLKVATAAV